MSTLDGIIGTDAIAEVDGQGRTGLVGTLEWMLVRLPAGAQVTAPTTAAVSLMPSTTDKYLVTFTRPGPEGDYAFRVLNIPGISWPIDDSFATYETVPGVASFVPEPADVGRILRTRTKDNLGNEIVDWSTSTRPTQADVVAIIQQAYDDVVAMTDDDIPLDSYRAARSVIALRAALQIELTYWPDQVPLGRSPYTQLKQLYDEELQRLQTSIARETEEAISGETTDTPLQPQYDFGDADQIGLDTRW